MPIQLDSGDYVHYEGLVPCGKDIWVTEDEDGFNMGQFVHIPCQFCHLFIMLSTIIGFLLTLLVPILAVGMLVVLLRIITTENIKNFRTSSNF